MKGHSKKIRSALVSVFSKEGLEPLIRGMHENGITIYSTGGTEAFIRELGIPVIAVEQVTSYPSILGGRVKTLHPKIFGGILGRRENEQDQVQLEEYEIPELDMVVVDLYPFEKTVASGATEEEIIEKIDIGGISLIRAASKNFADVVIIPSLNDYSTLKEILDNGGETSIELRKELASRGFQVSSTYDQAIHQYFSGEDAVTIPFSTRKKLRYGENPHQEGYFYGDMQELFTQLHGKELSYNNILDIDAAVTLIAEFTEPTFAILKHNNACGIASRPSLIQAWKDALQADPVSAFGGILITNKEVDELTAAEINKLFFEVLIAPGYSQEALQILKEKKNRILLVQKPCQLPSKTIRTALNGVLVQDRDTRTETPSDLSPVTKSSPEGNEIEDLLFANKIVKHTKSNTIVLAKNKQLLASGTGQTSRVDALRQAIHKAKSFGFSLQGAVMASDAFFPFPDCVEIAHQEGILCVIQPGGSIKDNESIENCNKNDMKMVLTGVRHFKH